MQKKSTSHSAFFNARALFAVLLCATAFSIVTGTLPVLVRSKESAKVSRRTLTFAERVAYQHAIEEVYWRHRIWPRNRGERRDPKPSLDAMISQAQLEKKVDDYLGKSHTLEDYCKQPITAEQLQAEMDRMANNTKKPEVLRELFEALGNDPFVIAECLARPALGGRLSVYSGSQLPNTPVTYRQLVASMGNYTLPTLPQRAGCTDDSWTAITTTNAPSPRDSHTAIWTGTEMIVWGGTSLAGEFNTGGRYNPATDNWTTITVANAPTARSSHTAIWTGSEMIVWGGTDSSSNYFNTGGRYTDSGLRVKTRKEAHMKTQLSKPARTKASYTEEYKQEALELWRSSGRSAAKVAAELGIRPPLLYRWAQLERQPDVSEGAI